MQQEVKEEGEFDIVNPDAIGALDETSPEYKAMNRRLVRKVGPDSHLEVTKAADRTVRSLGHADVYDHLHFLRTR